MKKLLLGLCLLFTPTAMANSSSSPVAVQQKAVDGYIYNNKDFNAEEAYIQIVRFNSYEELDAFLIKHFGKVRDGKQYAGYSIALHPKEKGKPALCRLFIVDPSKIYAPEYIGHELTHCIDGSFHKGQ